jgi:hypothetical protein
VPVLAGMTDSRPDRGDEEVDDVVTTLMTNTPDTGPSVGTARQAYTAPIWSEQGTGVPVAGDTGPSVHGLGMRTRSSSTPLRSPSAPVSSISRVLHLEVHRSDLRPTAASRPRIPIRGSAAFVLLRHLSAPPLRGPTHSHRPVRARTSEGDRRAHRSCPDPHRPT